MVRSVKKSKSKVFQPCLKKGGYPGRSFMHLLSQKKFKIWQKKS